MRSPLPALALLLLAGAASAADGEGDLEFEACMARAREAVVRARVVAEARLVGGLAPDPRPAKEAMDAFADAARLRPKDPVPPTEAGLFALEAGDGAAVARLLEQVHGIDPDSGPYHFLRGSLLRVRGEFLDARSEFRASKAAGFRAGPSEDRIFDCTLGMANQLVDAFRLEDAGALLEEAAALKPDHPLLPRSWVRVALARRRYSDPKGAEKVLRECTVRFPAYAPGWGELGNLLADLDRFDEAVEVLGKSLKADASFARGWILLARVRTLRGEFPQAEEAFRSFDRCSPADGESEYYRGLFDRARAEPAKALDHLRKSLELDPSRTRCHYQIALCCRDLGRDEEAAAAMEIWKKAEEARKSAGHAGGEKPPAAGGGSDVKEKEPSKE